MPDPKPPSPAAPVSSTRMYRAKLALRILQFSLAITVLGCAGKILTSGVWGLPTILTITPQTFVAAIWALAEAVCLVRRPGHRGIHPAACVAADLVLWLAVGGGAGALWMQGITAPAETEADADIDDDTLREVAALGGAVVWVGSALVIFQLVTFVIACVETRRRNRRGRAASVGEQSAEQVCVHDAGVKV